MSTCSSRPSPAGRGTVPFPVPSPTDALPAPPKLRTASFRCFEGKRKGSGCTYYVHCSSPHVAIWMAGKCFFTTRLSCSKPGIWESPGSSNASADTHQHQT